MKSRYQIHFRAPGRQDVTSSHNLSIPPFSVGPGVQNRDVWSVQSYEKFAQRLERQNPDTVLTKDMVDTAFRLAVLRTSRSTLNQTGRDQAVSRVSHDFTLAVAESRLTISVPGQGVYQVLERQIMVRLNIGAERSYHDRSLMDRSHFWCNAMWRDMGQSISASAPLYQIQLYREVHIVLTFDQPAHMLITRNLMLYLCV